MANTMMFGFEDGDKLPAAKDVNDTQMLEPRKGPEPFQTGTNSLTKDTSPHPSLGSLGDRGMAGSK